MATTIALQSTAGTNAPYKLGSPPDFGTLYSGRALDFDGVADFLEIADNESLDFGTGDFTYSLWIKTTQSTHGALFNQWDYTLTSSQWATSSFESQLKTNKFYLRVSNGSGGVEVTSTTSVNNGIWYYATVVRDGTTLRLYINGVQEDTGDVTGVDIPNSTRPLWVGKSDSSGSVYFDGKITNVQIWDKAWYPCT